jgi:hypothetical protein
VLGAGRSVLVGTRTTFSTPAVGIDGFIDAATDPARLTRGRKAICVGDHCLLPGDGFRS